MISLSDLKLSDLLPESVKNDKEISAIAAALDKELQAITACINETILLPRIDELPEDVVDMLAWQFHVDFYEPLGLNLDKKRALVKNSLSWHRRKGTKSAIEEIIRILFLDDFQIEEWFEYGGRPYYFRLIVNDLIENRQKYDDLIRAINELKNVRSWLERVRFKQEADMRAFMGIGTKRVAKSRIESKMINQDATLQINAGAVVKHIRRSAIPCNFGGVAFEL